MIATEEPEEVSQEAPKYLMQKLNYIIINMKENIITDN